MFTKTKIAVCLSMALFLTGCLSLGTRIGIGSDGVRGGVVVSGTQNVGGVTVGGSVGTGL